MKCSICSHQFSKEIGLALQEGRNRKEVAERYGLSPHALSRHIRKHAQEPKPEPPKPDLVPGFPNLANRVEWMYKQSSETYESAKSASDPDTQFKALQRLEKHVEMQAKIVGLIRAEKSGEIDLTNFMTQYNKVMAAVRVAAASGSPEMKELLAKFHDLATEFEKQGL